ncbi:MAG: transcriptional repressor [Oscillospiraceae bacterium]|jgi:Fe2+ or Zn2+ uptake regulation protein|nr:transcriptional repressor [Oscillospiraceae bacterium]
MAPTRRSRQRNLLLRELRGRTDHPTAESLHAALRAQSEGMSLGTVYRNLGVLAAQGEILELAGEDCKRFDGNTAPHTHLCCEICGCMEDLPAAEDAAKRSLLEAAAAYAAQNGMEADGVRILFTGKCKNCAAPAPQTDETA